MDDFLTYLSKNLSNVEFTEEYIDDEELLKMLAKSITSARNEAAMTQYELSKVTNIQQGTISKIENGNYNLTINMLERIAKGLGKKIIIRFE